MGGRDHACERCGGGGLTPSECECDPHIALLIRAETAEARVKELEHAIRWALEDAIYTAPEDHERRQRQAMVLRRALQEQER